MIKRRREVTNGHPLDEEGFGGVSYLCNEKPTWKQARQSSDSFCRLILEASHSPQVFPLGTRGGVSKVNPVQNFV